MELWLQYSTDQKCAFPWYFFPHCTIFKLFPQTLTKLQYLKKIIASNKSRQADIGALSWIFSLNQRTSYAQKYIGNTVSSGAVNASRIRSQRSQGSPLFYQLHNTAPLLTITLCHYEGNLQLVMHTQPQVQEPSAY